DHLQAQGELAAGLRRLIESIQNVLQPVLHLETLLNGRDQPQPVLPAFARACGDLLESLGIRRWLSPGPAVPEVECRRDQCAYRRLLAALQTLSRLPAEHVPHASQRQPDPLATLQLILESE